MTRRRAAIVIVVLACSGLVAQAAQRGRAVTADVTRLPYAIDAWTGHDAAPPDPETARQLAADSVVNRSYASGDGRAELYVAYYGEQRPNVSIHSPLHCLPGTGWEALDVRTLNLVSDGRSVGQVRRMVVQKNRDRALVLYWYAVHGRMLASELGSKLWLLHDRIRTGRSDAALVRIVVPIRGSEDAAERAGLAFTRDAIPYISKLWS